MRQPNNKHPSSQIQSRNSKPNRQSDSNNVSFVVTDHKNNIQPIIVKNFHISKRCLNRNRTKNAQGLTLKFSIELVSICLQVQGMVSKCHDLHTQHGTLHSIPNNRLAFVFRKLSQKLLFVVFEQFTRVQRRNTNSN